MCITAGKYTVAYVVFAQVAMCLGFAVLFGMGVIVPELDFRIWIVIAGTIAIVPFTVNLLFVIATFRTIIMDETGYTVKWWVFKKHYQWEDLKLKQYVHYKGVPFEAMHTNCFHAAEFFTKQVRIPKIMNGHLYSTLFHPFSFVFVCFPPSKTWHTDKPLWYHKQYPIPYEADEELFRAKLQEWGVEMAEVKRGVFADDDNWHETIN